MFAEAAAAPDAVRHLLNCNTERVAALAARINRFNPSMVVTCARGSSAHATAYGKCLFESCLGLATSAAAPSIASVYDRKLNLKRALYIAVSQSGTSPDIARHAAMAREQGAMVVVLVNEPDSPLARVAHCVIRLEAGPETSVAATKSYIVSLAALALLVAHMNSDSLLLKALHGVPDAMQAAWESDWSPLLETLASATSMFVVGRGVGYALSLEAALKLKETCGLHAEAYSAAEVRHGPMAMIGRGFPVLVFSQNDVAQDSVLRFARDARAAGAQVFVAGAGRRTPLYLPCPEPPHALLAPLIMAQSFYRFANALSILRGHNPDSPPHLLKVTETL